DAVHTPRGAISGWTRALAVMAFAAVAVPAAAQVSFADVTDACGIEMTHGASAAIPPLLGEQGTRFGAGGAVGDYDGDGWPDVYLCNSDGHSNRLYRNRGDGTFEDVTEQAGVGHVEGHSKMAMFLDLDNDGWDDLIVFN